MVLRHQRKSQESDSIATHWRHTHTLFGLKAACIADRFQVLSSARGEQMDIQQVILMQSMLHMQQMVALSDAAIVHTILSDREDERRRRKCWVWPRLSIDRRLHYGSCGRLIPEVRAGVTYLCSYVRVPSDMYD